MIIKTEVGVVIILTISLFTGILAVVGFDKTTKDLERIEESVQVNQKALNEAVRKVPKKSLNRVP